MHYFDDSDTGLSTETSHPRFTELAPARFYDEGDVFAPFGSDAGHDALRSLEDWFADEPEDADPIDFLHDLLEEWGFDVPEDMPEATPEELRLWVREDSANAGFAATEARARIAAALGQMKIAGALSSSMRAEADRGSRLLRMLAEDVTIQTDDDARAAALGALDEIDRFLDEA